MKEIGHWINGKRVAGTSGRFADVFNPATGEVQAKVALASKAELDAAVAAAAAAQPAWGATNPQRRARVMMEFVRLINRDMDKLAEALSSEHGKTFPDAKGDVQRGLEVIEFCIGAPQLLKGEFTDSAGPGIDMYSMRQPIGVAAGITPFNFPAMIPMWKMGPALAFENLLGVALSLKSSFVKPLSPPHAIISRTPFCARILLTVRAQYSTVSMPMVGSSFIFLIQAGDLEKGCNVRWNKKR